MRILFVCLGNICRSPMAEGILKAKAATKGLNWTIESAGTESYHIGEPPHRFSQKICRENGIDISAQRARIFTASDLGQWDKIYALASDVLREIQKIGGRRGDYSNVMLFLEELYPGRKNSVPDPWYGDESGYVRVYDLIEETCEAIIQKYA